MSSTVVFDPVTFQVLEFHADADPGYFANLSNIKTYNDTTTPTEAQVKAIFFTTPTLYVKVVGNDVQPMTAQEIAAVQSRIAQGENLLNRNDALGILADTHGAGKIQRAAALVTMDAVNVLRDWIAQFQAQVASATTLADLKTRVAGLPNLPQLNSGQIITAITSKINSGASD